MIHSMHSASDSSSVYDIVILGGGSGGYACALRAAQLGLSVALIEKAELGGTCLHRGCIPTKALLHTAEVADTTRSSEKFGVRATFESVDMPAAHRYKDAIVARLYKGLQGLVAGASIDLIHGEGAMASATTVKVGERAVAGRAVVLATGSQPRLLPEVSIGGAILTSEQAIHVPAIPQRVVVLGGGVIGVEFASIFASLGSDVTVVEGLERLVASEDASISAALRRAFGKRGIAVRTDTKVQRAQAVGDGVEVVLSDDTVLETDLLLVAVGRAPVTEELGLQAVGVSTDRGFVTTNARLQTSVEGVYAVGDIVPGLQLAHRGFAQGIFVAEEVAGLSPEVVDETGIPRVTYCDPEIVSVGLSAAQVEEQHGHCQIQEINLGGNGKSQILGTTGFVKIVRAASDGPVLGIHMIGARMAEQAGEAQLIVNWEALPQEVAALIHAHPTQNEALGEAHLALSGQPLHAHS